MNLKDFFRKQKLRKEFSIRPFALSRRIEKLLQELSEQEKIAQGKSDTKSSEKPDKRS